MLPRNLSTSLNGVLTTESVRTPQVLRGRRDGVMVEGMNQITTESGVTRTISSVDQSLTSSRETMSEQ